MKTWTNPSVEELEIEKTAYGWDRRWWEFDPFYPAGGTGMNPPGGGNGGEDETPEEDGYTPLS